jgi:hypothetical protein
MVVEWHGQENFAILIAADPILELHYLSSPRSPSSAGLLVNQSCALYVLIMDQLGQ